MYTRVENHQHHIAITSFP